MWLLWMNFEIIQQSSKDLFHFIVNF